MRKKFICISLSGLVLFPSIIAHAEETPTVVDKGRDATFYLETKNLLQGYLSKLEKNEITEQEFVNLVTENITPLVDEEVEEQALIESESKVVQPRSYSPYYGFEKFGVKATEIALFARYPLYSSKAKSLGEKALASASNRYQQYELWQGNGDAYRHAYWSALMTKHTTKTFAQQAGYAHEGYAVGSYDSIKDLDVKMDLSNNTKGRNDASDNTSLSDAELANYIEKSVDNGKKVRIRAKTSSSTGELRAGVRTKLYDHFIATSSAGKK